MAPKIVIVIINGSGNCHILLHNKKTSYGEYINVLIVLSLFPATPPTHTQKKKRDCIPLCLACVFMSWIMIWFMDTKSNICNTRTERVLFKFFQPSYPFLFFIMSAWHHKYLLVWQRDGETEDEMKENEREKMRVSVVYSLQGAILMLLWPKFDYWNTYYTKWKTYAY